MCIINNSRNFIFVHIPKTAGTSVTAYFAHFSAYNDLEVGGTPLGEALQWQFWKRFGVRKHSKLAEVAKLIGEDEIRSRYVFTFVREPLERLRSSFHFLRRWEDWSGHDEFLKFQTFEEFVASDYWLTAGPDNVFNPQVDWTEVSETLGRPMDYIGKVETIETDVAEICAALQINVLERPPNGVGRFNISSVDSGVDLPADLLAKILERYERDYQAFDYSTSYAPPAYLDSDQENSDGAHHSGPTHGMGPRDGDQD